MKRSPASAPAPALPTSFMSRYTWQIGSNVTFSAPASTLCSMKARDLQRNIFFNTPALYQGATGKSLERAFRICVWVPMPMVVSGMRDAGTNLLALEAAMLTRPVRAAGSPSAAAAAPRVSCTRAVAVPPEAAGGCRFYLPSSCRLKPLRRCQPCWDRHLQSCCRLSREPRPSRSTAQQLPCLPTRVCQQGLQVCSAIYQRLHGDGRLRLRRGRSVAARGSGVFIAVFNAGIRQVARRPVRLLPPDQLHLLL